MTRAAGLLAAAAALAAVSPTAFSVLPAAPSRAQRSRAAAGAGEQDLLSLSARELGSMGASAWTLAGLSALAAAAAAARSRSAARSGKVCRSAKGGEDEASAAYVEGKDASKLTESLPKVLSNEEIAKILPHRYPFLLVDKVVSFEAGKKAVGVKNVTANEPQFTGHFPDRPIMPGVLMVEAMAQLGGIVCLQEPVSKGMESGQQFFFAGIDSVKFRRPVVPGDTLVMEMELKKWRPKYGIAKMEGKAWVDGELALEVGSFTFALVNENAGKE